MENVNWKSFICIWCGTRCDKLFLFVWRSPRSREVSTEFYPINKHRKLYVDIQSRRRVQPEYFHCFIRCELWSLTPEQIKDLCRSCFRFSFHAHLRGRDSSFILFSVQDLCRRPTQLNQIQKIQLSSPSTMTKRTGVALSWSHRQNMLMLLFFSSRWKVLSGKFIIYIDWKLIWWWNMKRLLSIGIHRQ